MKRRQFIQSTGAWAGVVGLSTLSACATTGGSAKNGHIVVVGGGYGGATCAKYLRMWSQGKVQVTLIERNPTFVSCPISNLVLSGDKTIADITVSYEALRNKWGVKVIQGEVRNIDAAKKTVLLASGEKITYDRVVLSPGVDFIDGKIPALAGGAAFGSIPHAWKAGEQTVLLRQQLESMPDGGVFAITIPRAPYRCPPGPYERASMVASYFKRFKPKSKILILDANEKIQSKEALFSKAWQDLYPGMIEYRPQSECKDVDVAQKIAKLEFESVKADVLNVIPPMRAGQLVFDTGLSAINNLWAEVDWPSMESVNTPFVHVIGDAVFPAPTMPKSGHMANQHAKVTAAAILNMLEGVPPNPEPVVMNTCYSFVDPKNVIHVASVHQYNPAKKTYDANPNHAGGVSAARNTLEAKIAMGWANNIWADSLG